MIPMHSHSEKYLYYFFFPAYILLQVFLIIISESAYGYGGADNIAHYQISRYSFKYPELLLDLWGKPVYTLLSAPFAQFGYNVAKIFNVMIAIFTLLISAKIAKRLFPVLLSSFFVVLFIAFSPVYFLLAASCLTEVLFSFLLVAAVYLFIRKRFILAAVVLSFLPLVRSEGIVLFPVFAVALVLSRSYRSLPFLITGLVFYSVIGYFVYGEILWLISRQPYSMGESIYGSGSLFHFLKHSPSIFGIPLLILIFFGLIFWVSGLAKRFSLLNPDTILFILIAGSWITFFAAHSYVWWKGTGGSLGLTRVIGSVIPLAALTGMKAFEALKKIVKRKAVVYGLFSALAVLQIVFLFTRHNLFLRADATEQLIKKSAEYISSNEPDEKVYYFNPLLIHYLGYDPYDTSQCNWWVADKQQPSNTLDWSDLLVWDAHLGPNEGGVQLESLEKDPLLKKVKAFYPLEKIIVLGGYDYSVQIYKKVKSKIDSLQVADSYSFTLDFNTNQDERVKVADGLRVWELDSHQEFSPAITLYPEVLKRHDIIEIEVTVSFKALQSILPDETLLVFSVDDKGKNLRYEKLDLSTERSNWQQMKLYTRIPAAIPDSANMVFYIWNKNKNHLLIEKIQVEMKSY
jgi:hypothetical protein